MQMNEYVAQKLRELENERTDSLLKMRLAESVAGDRRQTSKPLIAPVLRAAGRTLRRAKVKEPDWRPDGDEREREARLLPRDAGEAVVIPKEEPEAGETPGRRRCGELCTDPQQVGDADHDHEHRDERDQVEIRALQRWQRPVGSVHRLIMAHGR